MVWRILQAGTRNAFLAESGFLPQLAANIDIFQTNAQFVGIFSSDSALLSLAYFSPIMRPAIACWASAQREGAYHGSGSASGALPYAVKKSVFHIHRCLAFEIIDMHCLIPKYVSGATSNG